LLENVDMCLLFLTIHAARVLQQAELHPQLHLRDSQDDRWWKTNMFLPKYAWYTNVAINGKKIKNTSPLICIAFFSQKDTCKKPTFSLHLYSAADYDAIRAKGNRQIGGISQYSRDCAAAAGAISGYLTLIIDNVNTATLQAARQHSVSAKKRGKKCRRLDNLAHSLHCCSGLYQ
jgi:hypothetical protein